MKQAPWEPTPPHSPQRLRKPQEGHQILPPTQDQDNKNVIISGPDTVNLAGLVTHLMQRGKHALFCIQEGNAKHISKLEAQQKAAEISSVRTAISWCA